MLLSIFNEKLIFEVGRIDKTYKVEQKYLRLDKKSPEFDKAFYKVVRKNKDTRFLISVSYTHLTLPTNREV